MPKVTPRDRLVLAVRAKFLDMGMPPTAATRAAAESVDAFYAHDQDHTHFALVSSVATQVMLDVIPPVAVHIREVFESIHRSINQIAASVQAVAPYFEMMANARVNPRPQQSPPFVGDNGFGPGCTCGGRGDDGESCPIGSHPPDDRITGYPHHYVLNGDHSECPCGGDHLVECEIWNDPEWKHKGSICGVARTLCDHHPRHHYGQVCEDYADRTGGGGGAKG